MIHKRKSNHPRGLETKSQILEAGFALMSHKGLHGTNSREIAEAAGVSIGSFYTYFKDKRQLFIQLFKSHCGRILELLNEFPVEKYMDQDPREVVHSLITTIWSLNDSGYPLNQKAMALRESDLEIARIMDEQEQAIVQRLMALLLASQPRLRVRDLETAAWLVDRVIIGVMFGLSQSKPGTGKERLLPELVDLICRYLFG